MEDVVSVTVVGEYVVVCMRLELIRSACNILNCTGITECKQYSMLLGLSNPLSYEAYLNETSSGQNRFLSPLSIDQRCSIVVPEVAERLLYLKVHDVRQDCVNRHTSNSNRNRPEYFEQQKWHRMLHLLIT